MTDYYADRLDSDICGSRLLIYKRGDVDDLFYFGAVSSTAIVIFFKRHNLV
jgi:hypothetical protein